MDVLETLYIINNNDIQQKRINRLNQINRRIERSRIIRERLLQRQNSIKSDYNPNQNKIENNELDEEKSNDEESNDEESNDEESNDDKKLENNESDDESDDNEHINMEDLEEIEEEYDDDTDSDDDIDENTHSIIILPSFMNWYTCGYEHVIKSINAPLKVFDLTMIESDIERIISSVKYLFPKKNTQYCYKIQTFVML